MDKLKMKLGFMVLSLALLGGACVAGTTPEAGSPKAEQEAVDEATKDWEVYQHLGPDYQVKYPEGWIPKLTPNPTMGDLEFLGISTTAEEFTPTDCSFGVKTWDQGMSGELEIAQERAVELGEVDIDGVQAQKYVYAPNEQYMSHSYFLEKDGYSYVISFGLKKDVPSEACLETMNNILGTFKFGK